MQRIKKKIFNYLTTLKKNKVSDNCYITCCERNDGLGAQVQAYLSVLLIAKQYNLTYIHTPFKILDHEKGNEKFFEDFFNLGDNKININDLNTNLLEIKTIKHPFEIKVKENILYKTQGLHQYADKYPNSYLNIMDNIEKKFFDESKKQFQISSTASTFSIALHIRRGDVSLNKNSGRFTENIYYVEVLKFLYKLFEEFNIKLDIHLYSQGKVEDFQELNEFDITFHLNESLDSTFIGLVNKDILVMSKSSLSYCAALYSKNIVLYKPFWHNPLSKWHTINEDDKGISFNREKLLKDINDLIIVKK